MFQVLPPYRMYLPCRPKLYFYTLVYLSTEYSLIFFARWSPLGYSFPMVKILLYPGFFLSVTLPQKNHGDLRCSCSMGIKYHSLPQFMPLFTNLQKFASFSPLGSTDNPWLGSLLLSLGLFLYVRGCFQFPVSHGDYWCWFWAGYISFSYDTSGNSLLLLLTATISS